MSARPDRLPELPDAPSRALAGFAVRAQVPEPVRRVTRRYLLDWLGSSLAGGELHPPARLRAVVESLGGAEQATVLATGERTSAPLAALANAAAAHVLEMDDLDRASISHPGAPVIAAALAVAESLDASGDALLDAIAVGYEVGTRVGSALGPGHYEHWHTTGTAGTLGAAAAAARLHALDPARALHAVGSAGTMAAGLWEFLADGAMSKQLHPAKAAHDGILAALLAREGFTAASRILEGPKGLLAAASSTPDPAALTAGLADDMQDWRIAGVSFKVHASCRHTHSAVDAALELRERVSPEAIEQVEIRLYRQALGLLDGMEPTTPYAAKFSLPFCVASALVHGDLAPHRFSDAAIADPRVLRIAERTRFATDPELDALYPAAWPSVVEITAADGSRHRARVDHPAGDPERGLDDAAVSAKFVTITGALHDDAPALAACVLDARPLPGARALARRAALRGPRASMAATTGDDRGAARASTA